MVVCWLGLYRRSSGPACTHRSNLVGCTSGCPALLYWHYLVLTVTHQELVAHLSTCYYHAYFQKLQCRGDRRYRQNWSSGSPIAAVYLNNVGNPRVLRATWSFLSPVNSRAYRDNGRHPSTAYSRIFLLLSYTIPTQYYTVHVKALPIRRTEMVQAEDKTSNVEAGQTAGDGAAV